MEKEEEEEVLIEVNLSYGSSLRVFCISDIHVDHKENLEYIQQILNNNQDYSNDVIIIAGDVASKLSIIEETLLLFVKTFKFVFYVPGNHELWITTEDKKLNSIDEDDLRNKDEDGKKQKYNSFDKLESIVQLCKKIGVYTTFKVIHLLHSSESLFIFPLFSWYESHFDSEINTYNNNNNNNTGSSSPTFDETLYFWSDFSVCVWPFAASTVPELLAIQYRVSDALLKKNEVYFSLADHYFSIFPSSTNISFSHFVPREDLIPSSELLTFKPLRKVAGSVKIEKQIVKCKSDIHIFGHTHMKYDAMREGRRYVQNPLGYPRERQFLGTNTFKCLWKSS